MTILIAAMTGIAIYLFIVILFSRSGERHDALRQRIVAIGAKNAKIPVDDEINKPLSERLIKPIIKSLARKVKKPRATANTVKNEKELAQKKKLNQAGINLTVEEYGIVRLLVIGGCAAFLAVIALVLSGSVSNAFFGAAAGFFMGYAGMRFFLVGAIKRRNQQIEYQLPDVLDLLSVSVEAGLGFEQAVQHVTTNMEGPLIDELTVTYREMSMGRSRKDALALLAERCDIEEVKSFAGALAQAAQLGISIKNVLRSQSSAMRQSRRAKVQEKAMKVSVKMLFPMLIFIFPVIFIMLLGPAVVNVLKTLAG